MYFVLMGEWNPPNKFFTPGERLVNPLKGTHVLKRAASHLCDVNTLGILACSFSTFLKALIQPSCLARVFSWLTFVVVVFMGHENGENKGRPRDDTCKA